MAAGFLLFSTADMLSKLLTQDMHPIQVAFVRQTGLLFGVAFLLLRFGPGILHTRRPGLQVLRGVTSVITATTFVLALAYVPLADAVAVSFIAPLLVTVMAALILHERIGKARWLAVLVGLIGTLIVVRPGAGVVHPAMLFVVVCAVAFAARQILSRFLAGHDSLQTTIAYSGISACALLAVPVAILWHTPGSPGIWLLMAATALSAGLAELSIIHGLEIAQAAVVAPTHYTLLIWSIFWGFLVFGQLPDVWTVVGATIIIGSGLYTFWRETLRR